MKIANLCLKSQIFCFESNQISNLQIFKFQFTDKLNKIYLAVSISNIARFLLQALKIVHAETWKRLYCYCNVAYIYSSTHNPFSLAMTQWLLLSSSVDVFALLIASAMKNKCLNFLFFFNIHLV